MATDLRNLLANIAATADFRAWGSGLAAQFAAVGLVKTSDTGQINWTTVTTPGTNTLAGYEIWRFNDSLQATKPVFIKIEYGQSPYSGSHYLRFQTCTATDGAGTPTSQVGVQRICYSGIAAKLAGTLVPSYCSGTSSRLCLMTNGDATNFNYGTLFLIERTKLGDGTETGDGFVTFSNSAISYFQMTPFTGSVPGSVAYNSSLPISGGVSAVGVDVALSPTITFAGKCLFASWCCYNTADLSALATFTMTHLGATRTFLSLGGCMQSTYTNPGGVSNHSLAMLWE